MEPDHQFESSPPSPSIREPEGEVSGIRVVSPRPRPTVDAHIPDPPPAPPAQTVLDAALHAERTAQPGVDLAEIWQSILERRSVVVAAGSGPSTRFVVVTANEDVAVRSSPLSRLETALLVRVLRGHQQKFVAAELGIACSTASKWYTSALQKVRLAGAPVPLPLVIAAQAWGGGPRLPVDARSATFRHEGDLFFLLAVPRPAIDPRSNLTLAERMIAELIIEGEPRWEIARRRETSMQTVACQVRGVFSKYRLTGRHALIARAVELGWFSQRN